MTTRPSPSTPRRGLSRRRLLRLMALGGAATVIGTSVAIVGAQTNQHPGTDFHGLGTAELPPQHGRRVVITGGNGYPEGDRGGLGFHVALGLARAGADVLIASRNQLRGDETVRQIKAQAPDARIRFMPLDLADLTSVRAFAEHLQARGEPIDLLVNNAGVMGRLTRETSLDGFERVFAVNTLGHFALTAQLLPLLRRGHHPRVVWVGSMRTATALPFADLQLEQRYDYAAAYDNSKLANLLLAFEFSRRSLVQGWGVTSVAAHPGVARTNLIPDGPGLNSAEGFRFRFLPFLFQPAAAGALPILHAATTDGVGQGDYFGPTGFLGMGGPPGPAVARPETQDAQAANMLWSLLEEMSRTRMA